MRLEEWAKVPTFAPYTWAVRRDSVIICAQVIVGSERHESLKSIGPPPYTFMAVPQRGGLPTVEVDLAAGMEPIWVHRCRIGIPLGVGGEKLPLKRFSYVALGRRHPDGREEVWTIFPDGEVKRFDSVAEAIS